MGDGEIVEFDVVEAAKVSLDMKPYCFVYFQFIVEVKSSFCLPVSFRDQRLPM